MFKPKIILFPIDLDSEDVTALIAALEVAEFFQSEIHILYVNEPLAGFRYPTDREDTVALRVNDVAPPALLKDQRIVYAAAKGNLGEEIVRYCGENNIELIIVGHKHRRKIYSTFFDSPDVNIIDAVKLPVLVIPEV